MQSHGLLVVMNFHKVVLSRESSTQTFIRQLWCCRSIWKRMSTLKMIFVNNLTIPRKEVWLYFGNCLPWLIARPNIEINIIVIWRHLGLKFKLMAHRRSKKVSYGFWLKTLRNIKVSAAKDHGNQFRSFLATSFPRGGTSISLTGMIVREQISTTQKSRMTLNSNPKK